MCYLCYLILLTNLRIKCICPICYEEFFVKFHNLKLGSFRCPHCHTKLFITQLEPVSKLGKELFLGRKNE